MSSSAVPVLVVGGGPSGLVAALTLLQNNVPVRIIDKAREYHVGQRGNGIWPRSFDLFHFLRVPEIHQKSKRMIPLQEYKLGTLEVANTAWVTTHRDPSPSIPYINAKLIGQPLLEGILRSHLEKYSCFVELGTELQSFEADGERVLAKLVKRRDDEEIFETFEASYLIGTDGAKGVTRKQLGLTFLGETKHEFASVIGDICLEVEGMDREHWHFFGRRAPGSDFLALRPTDEIASDGYQFVMTSKDYEPKQLVADEKLTFECMSKTVGREVKVRKIVIMSEFRPNVRMVDKFNVGRVFVAGDAAHVHSPAGGQGLNSSVQDALNLAWKLALVYKGLSPFTLLDSYTAERLPVIAEMLNVTTGKLQELYREPTIDRAMQREDRLNMLGVNYRMSPIVVDEFATAEPVSSYRVLDESVLVAGDRAPDAPRLIMVIDGTAALEARLFDVFGSTHHTVLVFTPDTSLAREVLQALKKYDVGNAIQPLIILPRTSEVTTGKMEAAEMAVDRDGHAYRVYLTEEGEKKVVVIRPDGVVGAILHGVDGMETYFTKIFF